MRALILQGDELAIVAERMGISLDTALRTTSSPRGVNCAADAVAAAYWPE